MPFDKFNIYLLSDSYETGMAAIVERDWDHLVYDFGGDKKFKAGSATVNPYIPLVKDTGRFEGRMSAELEIDPSVFVDGEYIVNFVRADRPDKPIFSMAPFEVFKGKATIRPLDKDELADAVVAKLPTTSGGAAPTAAQNASALMNFQYKTVTSAGTVGAVLAGTYDVAATTKSLVAALSVPTAAQNATAFLKAPYKSVTDAGSVAAVLNAINTTVSGVPTSAQNAAAVMNAPYKEFTAPGSLSALFTSIHTGMTNVGTKMSSISYDMGNIANRMNNVSDKLTSFNTTLGTVWTRQSETVSSVQALEKKVNTLLDKLSAIETKLNKLSS